ncbi:RNA-binding protein Nova-2-like isoform X2 [Limulus polyphemus]|uniref:RNA-binding protein Nova-2-like isoform X2 n=1 Tax=Limulus polyphemus TaxID=6850 RepID=A0ABM1T6Y9_LIMPO|nr:RNA-binding protein Nova-2-like isoform X2 [Limulus polyphemus]
MLPGRRIAWQSANGTYHFKILVPSVAAGAIIGKGGETIAQLQNESGARIKMSKANDFYPGTTERVCLITGSLEGITMIHEFITEKIREKPDPNAKMAIDFDHKQPAEREKQIKILVPNSTAGMIIGKGGSYIKQIKEESGAYVQISQKSRDHALAERCITVIGETENNKTAFNLILAKIAEDPQSGSCLNVSYADISGPVANFNPTGSPYASSSCGQGNGGLSNNNTSYSSSGSLSSISPTMNSNFGSSQGTASTANIMPFSAGMGMGSRGVPNGSATQGIDNIKLMLRGNGYSEQATAEIATAMNTLANYGVLGLGLGGMLNSMNGATMMGGIGTSANCPIPPGNIPNQGMFTSCTGVPEMDITCSAVTTSGPITGGSNIFGPLGGNMSTGMSNVGMFPGFSSPSVSRSNERFHFQGDGSTAFDPFQRNSPVLGSPNTPNLPINNNSFGLGTCLNSGPSAIHKSPTTDDQQGETAKIEVEVCENIVGAILGPGGKSLLEIQRLSGANIQISKKGIFAPGTRNRIVTITGPPTTVSTAHYLIEQQISGEEAKRARQNSFVTIR